MTDSNESRTSWIAKDVECINSPHCKTWSRITIPKGSNLKGKKYLCGFCSNEKDAAKDAHIKQQNEEIQKLKSLLNQKIDEVKKHVNEKLDDLKIDLQPHPQTSDAPHRQLQNASVPDRHLNLIMFGCHEEEENDPKKRFEKMNSTVKSNLETIGIDIKESVCDFFRRGKRTPGKNRPIILRTANIWEKRKIIGGFRNELPQRNLSYTIREDRPPNPEFKRFKEEARKLNNELQQEADRESKTVNKSYSARDTGLVLFVLRNGKWQQSEE